ncbi:MAG: cation:dicarboxylase symporter family transporter [Gammaproteobacteria bacterium]
MAGALARTWAALGLSGRILAGLAAGILAGLAVGESAAELEPLADIYIRLMQMTVLPYLVSALVLAFGQLDVAHARRLAVRGGLLLLVVWALTVALLMALPTTFPHYVTASFFSQSLVEPPQAFSLAEIYFTANPFESLSRNVVPAVVVFSSLFGIGLIAVPDKERLLGPIRVGNAVIVRITRFVIELTPLGVFAIGAVAAGTMTLETLARLEVYFVTFAAAALLLGFWILPLLVTAVTPFRYREVAGIARDALLTAFVASNAFIVLPVLVERARELLERHGLLSPEADSAAEVLVPVLFNFPNAGKLLTLLFIPFAAWLAGQPLGGGDYAMLFGAGIPSYFAKAQTALPYLLDLFGLPHDLFHLYVPTTILTGKFDSLVTAMNLLVFALVGAAAMGGFLVLERGRLLRAALAIVGGSALVLVAVAVLLGSIVDTRYTLSDAVRHMHTARPDLAAQVIEATAPPADAPAAPLARAVARGTLRFGFDPGNLPFSFYNSDGQLVGYDVELALRAATALGLDAEFVAVEWSRVPELLATGVIDVMPGIWYRPNWFGRLKFSRPYLEGTMALVTRDARRHEFASIANLVHSRGLRIGVPLDLEQHRPAMRRYFGDAAVEFVVTAPEAAFQDAAAAALATQPGGGDTVDAFLMPAEHAAGFTLLHPEFTVVVPQPHPVHLSTAFGVGLTAEDLEDALDEWIVLARDSGELRELYDYWILGQGAASRQRRWSLLGALRDGAHAP